MYISLLRPVPETFSNLQMHHYIFKTFIFLFFLFDLISSSW